MRVDSVAPGATLTWATRRPGRVLDAMTAGTPAGVVVQPDDIARAVLYLASDDARMGPRRHALRRRRDLRHPAELSRAPTAPRLQRSVRMSRITTRSARPAPLLRSPPGST